MPKNLTIKGLECYVLYHGYSREPDKFEEIRHNVIQEMDQRQIRYFNIAGVALAAGIESFQPPDIKKFDDYLLAYFAYEDESGKIVGISTDFLNKLKNLDEHQFYMISEILDKAIDNFCDEEIERLKELWQNQGE